MEFCGRKNFCLALLVAVGNEGGFEVTEYGDEVEGNPVELGCRLGVKVF